jgi:hypothetical protein
LLLLLIIQVFFLFSLVGVCVFPSHLAAAIWWQHGSPPGFSI